MCHENDWRTEVYYPGPYMEEAVRSLSISDEEIALNIYTQNPARAMLRIHEGEVLYKLQSDMSYEPLGIVMMVFPRANGYLIRYRSE